MLNGFQDLFDAWVASGYAKKMVPSLDRIDPTKTYSLDNVRLVTWYENYCKVGLDSYRKPKKNNKSGVSGVIKNNSQTSPWKVSFRIKGRWYNLGVFATLEEAVAVRVKWMEEHQQEHYPGL
jgi:hypothetical protein